jgi:hypothetical protein
MRPSVRSIILLAAATSSKVRAGVASTSTMMLLSMSIR